MIFLQHQLVTEWTSVIQENLYSCGSDDLGNIFHSLLVKKKYLKESVNYGISYELWTDNLMYLLWITDI